jgi:hypothetical protein
MGMSSPNKTGTEMRARHGRSAVARALEGTHNVVDTAPAGT